MRTVIENVTVFDGRMLRPPTTVVIDGPLIGTDATNPDQVIDGTGRVLMPGLIDAHVHLHGPETLTALASYGVTTALDMATWPPDLVDSLRNSPGVTNIRSAGTPATASGSTHSRIPGLPISAMVNNTSDARSFVAERVAEGSDYIKIVADIPGPTQDVIDAIVDAASARRMITVAHAATTAAYMMAIAANVAVITHAPLDGVLSVDAIAAMVEHRTVCIPTLTMMHGVVTQRGLPTEVFTPASKTVTALHAAGVTILAGTDANASAGVPANVEHGKSIHRELELLVDAGLTPTEALRSATSITARHFRLSDRGMVEPGYRADLVLLDGDPTADISVTRQLHRIWCGGIEHPTYSNSTTF